MNVKHVKTNRTANVGLGMDRIDIGGKLGVNGNTEETATY